MLQTSSAPAVTSQTSDLSMSESYVISRGGRSSSDLDSWSDDVASTEPITYTPQDSPDIIDDIDDRREFQQLGKISSPIDDALTEAGKIIPYFMLRRELSRGRLLRFKSYQLFTSNFMNPDTPYTRLVINHEMGAGKTASAIGIAMRFIEVYRILTAADTIQSEKRCVYIIGFTRLQFERDLFRFTEFGFITRTEQEYLAKLKKYAQLGAENDVKAYKEFYIKLRRRLGNFKGNGYFKFIGYRELSNRVFMSNTETTHMSETELRAAIASGKIAIDMNYIAQFKDNLIICDEIHNVYNSLAKNNWGIAIQIILNEFGPRIRALFLSGTMIKNSQTESIDIMNLAIGTREREYKRSEFFDSNDQPLPGAIKRIGELLRGRVSFLVDINPKYFPKSEFIGEPILQPDGEVTKYIMFQRCEMTPDQMKAYDSTAGDISTLHEYPYLFDMVFPRPEITNPIKSITNGGGYGDDEQDETIAPTQTPPAPTKSSSASSDQENIADDILEQPQSDDVEDEPIEKSMVRKDSATSADVPIFKTSGLRLIESAPIQWRNKYEIAVQSKEKTVTGAILQRSNIGRWSGKYARMLDLLDNILTNGLGKVFIFHKFIHMTGVFLIGNILVENGFTNIGMQPGPGARCALCGRIFSDHGETKSGGRVSDASGGAKSKSDNGDVIVASGHEFTPARFVIVHGELDKRTMSSHLDKFNSADNTDGSKLLVIIGSRVMKESYDLMATRHVMVISRPDNIPSLAQITARAVRSGSHQLLPKDKQTVGIYIFTGAFPKGRSELSYEEDKYSQKINDYVIIQQIEREIHANAVDANINRKLIEPALKDDALGHLRFEPVARIRPTVTDFVDQSTFDMFYQEREVADIVYIVKRLFMEDSRVWRRDDLLVAVRAPPFDFEYDASRFSDGAFSVAMHHLCWRDDYFGESGVDASGQMETRTVFDVLTETYDKRILLSGVATAVIVAIGDYYIAFALDAATKKPIIMADAPYRMPEPEVAQSYNIAPYVHTILSQQRYLDLKTSFAAKFKGKQINEMTDAICMHGHDFHLMLIEESITYVFNLWTDPKMVASVEYNAFYFQMLYFYDALGFIIWLDSAREFIREIYSDYDNVIHVNKKTARETLLPPKYSEKNRGDLIHIARTIERSGCSWCPNSMKSQYDAALEKSKLRFAKLKSDKLVATDDAVPIGHIMDEVSRFYHPERGWFASPEYSRVNDAWKENDLIIGFDLRSTGGMHIRFRLRNPRQKIEHHNDARLIERGIICTSRSREYLIDLAKKLGIKQLKTDANLGDICREIRARLLYLELDERARGTNIKYYYNQYESAAIDT